MTDQDAMGVTGALLADQGAYDAFTKGMNLSGQGVAKALFPLHTYLAGMPAGVALRAMGEEQARAQQAVGPLQPGETARGVAPTNGR